MNGVEAKVEDRVGRGTSRCFTASGFSASFQLGQIRQVARAPRLPLGPDQFLAPDHQDFQALHFDGDVVLPRLVKAYPTDVRENVDATGRNADLEHEVTFREISGLELMEGYSERLERFPHPCCVFRRRPDQMSRSPVARGRA